MKPPTLTDVSLAKHPQDPAAPPAGDSGTSPSGDAKSTGGGSDIPPDHSTAGKEKTAALRGGGSDIPPDH